MAKLSVTLPQLIEKLSGPDMFLYREYIGDLSINVFKSLRTIDTYYWYTICDVSDMTPSKKVPVVHESALVYAELPELYASLSNYLEGI